MLDRVKEFVNENFKGKSVEHFERTVYWIKKLRPDADEPNLIAAYAHDIARAFREDSSEETFRDREMNDPEILEEHQKGGAEIIARFLEKERYDANGIKRVKNMIARHEIGGDEESDLLKEADSISYLEINAPKHARVFIASLGKDKVRRKFDWMFDRISSDEARVIAKPFYEKALELLEGANES